MAYIELVIKIPEEKYNYVKNQVAEGIDNPLKVYIANGIPLDKIRAEIEHMIPCSNEALSMKLGVLEIIDMYKDDWCSEIRNGN